MSRRPRVSLPFDDDKGCTWSCFAAWPTINLLWQVLQPSNWKCVRAIGVLLLKQTGAAALLHDANASLDNFVRALQKSRPVVPGVGTCTDDFAYDLQFLYCTRV